MIGAHALTIKADLTYRQVDFWTRCGYLKAVHVDITGSGYPREYGNDQLPIARHMSRLTKAGLPAKLAHQAALQLLADGKARLGDFTLVPNDRQEAS